MCAFQTIYLMVKKLLGQVQRRAVNGPRLREHRKGQELTWSLLDLSTQDSRLVETTPPCLLSFEKHIHLVMITYQLAYDCAEIYF